LGKRCVSGVLENPPEKKKSPRNQRGRKRKGEGITGGCLPVQKKTQCNNQVWGMAVKKKKGLRDREKICHGWGRKKALPRRGKKKKRTLGRGD